MAGKKKKVRANFRKNRNVRVRKNDWTSEKGKTDAEDAASSQSVTGKGEFTRKRTVAGAELVEDASGEEVLLLDVDQEACSLGRVLRVQGLVSVVQLADGTLRNCATRRLLKTLSTDQRHVVAAGDRVWVRPEGEDEGFIERVEPRRGVISRTSRGRRHVIVTNVDQVLIVASAAEPRVKPNLIDRYLIAAEKYGIEPVICINKIDLIDPAELQPLVGVYAQLGYRVLLISATTGQGMERLRAILAGRQSAVAGQSGVGKSSLLNSLEPSLGLRVQTVSTDNDKGRHTTTTAEMIPLASGGYVVDTPGIRQFQLWDVIEEELDGFFRELRPYVSQCRYPDCTHDHEEPCAVKDAVADGYINLRRYESYLQMLQS
ncbi:ribosome small subunit-dependent GTPase A [Adhaeretor mobilis]|uniref:Small ribosomal subunit biogenesis GTPase RsgA n=1 Tax=Adhaeretor mobilis TaxID=1930276 RepID=A0A517MV05_9BACT|nr:ribosome small subunit-dependent GTPase A [Adhaeretor mobilis]QDS98705.1 Putative ribosome biogenesis GTPase RsgA [Adhaeretor mobilis]